MTRFILVLQLVLLALKIGGNDYVELYSWWWILAPVWLYFGGALFIFFSFYSIFRFKHKS